jgi:hypothetical protein
LLLGAKFCQNERNKNKKGIFLHNILTFFDNKLPTFENVIFSKITFLPQFDFDLSLVAF